MLVVEAIWETVEIVFSSLDMHYFTEFVPYLDFDIELAKDSSLAIFELDTTVLAKGLGNIVSNLPIWLHKSPLNSSFYSNYSTGDLHSKLDLG